ncbi:Cytochrome P450 [Sesbania bispinosa]|nr:Cytochrome P450 [Sesbania bispinosa]
MEAQLSFSVSITITFFLLFLLHWVAKYYKSLAHKLPPGPTKLPLIGNLYQLAVAGSLPHHALRELAHKYGPLMHLQLGEISTVIVSSPKIAKEIMKTHDVAFANRPQLLSPQILAYGATDIAFSPYGDYWRQMRKICVLELLSTKRVQSFSYIREVETAKFIKSIQSSAGSLSPINVTSRIFSLISSIVSRAAFGDKSQDQDEFVSLIRKAIALTGGFELADVFPSMTPIHILTGVKSKYERIHKRADKILENIIKKHQEKQTSAKEAEKEDLVDVLLRLQQSSSLEIQLTNSNIKAVIWVSNT